jgi:CrcB protein
VKLALIALFGGLGALARYGLGVGVGPRSFPWTTLGINLSGSLVLALVLTVGVERHWSSMVTAPVAVGFLGAYTTFSTYSYETFALARTDRVAAAAAYVVASTFGGILAAWIGYRIALRVS